MGHFEWPSGLWVNPDVIEYLPGIGGLGDEINQAHLDTAVQTQEKAPKDCSEVARFGKGHLMARSTEMGVSDSNQKIAHAECVILCMACTNGSRVKKSNDSLGVLLYAIYIFTFNARSGQYFGVI